MEKAFSILGRMEHDSCLKPVVGVLFLPEAACDAILKNGQLGMKTLRGLGFETIGSSEPVMPLAKTDGHTLPTLYYFINGPAPQCVYVKELTSCGRKNGEAKLVEGEPLAVIPAVSGSTWNRFVKNDDRHFPKIIGPKPHTSGKVIAR